MKIKLPFIEAYRELAFKPAPLALSLARLALCFVVWYDFKMHVLFSEDYLRTVTCYDPKGILNLFHTQMPTLAELNMWIAVKDVALFMFAIGLFTRISGATLLLCNLHLMGFFESINRDGYWCHGSNVLLLTQLAFLFAQPGVFSFDYFLSKRLKSFPKFFYHPEKQYAWPVLLGQAATALMFVNSFYWKMLKSGPAWALSDNMRNIFILQYEMTLFQDYPKHILAIISNQFYYKGIAILNLILQISPLIALFVIKRPVLRAAVGLGFVIETIGLLVFMGLDDLEWIALYAFFVDWDYFFGKSLFTAPSLAISNAGARWVRGFTYVFLGFYFLSGYNFILPKFCCVYNTYPFSAFPMYSDNQAKKPYGDHQGYAKDGLSFDIVGYSKDNPYPEEVMEKKLAYLYYPSDKYLPTEEKKQRLCNSVYYFLKSEKIKYERVNMYFCFRIVDPYPAKPYARKAHLGYHSGVDSSGKADFVAFTGFQNDGDRVYLVAANRGYLQGITKLEYLTDPMQPTRPVIDFEVKGDTLFYENPFGDRVGTLFIYSDSTSKLADGGRMHTLLYDKL
jgi:hypothetical protein